MDLQREAMILEMNIHMIHMKCNFLLMEDENMHPGQMALLQTMKVLGLSSQRTLAKRLNCSPASIGVSIKRLERVGLVEKQIDSQDMRVTRVALTERGIKLAEESEAIVMQLGIHKFQGFTDEEMVQFNEYLQRMKVNLEQFQGELSRQKEERRPKGGWTPESRDGCSRQNEHSIHDRHRE